MPQLTAIAIAVVSGALLYFRCPYQAKVMKMFENSSSTMGARRSRRVGMGAVSGKIMR
jgi:hypothetical protein